MGLGVDLGTSTVKVVALRKSLRGWRLVGVSRRRVDRAGSGGEPGALPDSIDCLGGWPKGSPAVLGLSGRALNLQMIHQPAMKMAQYRTLMGYELDQRRGEGGDLYVGYGTLREPDSYFPQYLTMVGLARKEHVDPRVAFLEAGGLAVRDAVPNAWALAAVYQTAVPASDATHLLVDIGAANTEFALMRGGRLIFARNLSSGADLFDASIRTHARVDAGKAEAYKFRHGTLLAVDEATDPKGFELQPALRTAAGQFIGILQSSLGFAKMQLQEKDLVVDRVYLSGGGARIPGLTEYLKSALKTEVEILDPFAGIRVPDVEGMDEVRRLPSDLAVATGLALISSGIASLPRFSLVPEHVARRHDFYSRRIFLWGAAAAAAMLLGVLTLTALFDRINESARDYAFRGQSGEIRQRVEGLDAAERELTLSMSRSGLLKQHATGGRAALEAVARLKKILPEGVFIRSVALQPTVVDEREEHSLQASFALYRDPRVGIVHGRIISRGEEALQIENQEKIPLDQARDLMLWEAPCTGLAIHGEIDGNVSREPERVVDALVEQLQDPSRSISSRREAFDRIKERPGWRSFTIVVSAR